MLGPIGTFLLGRNSWQELRIDNKNLPRFVWWRRIDRRYRPAILGDISP
jgi:hypothetical protein